MFADVINESYACLVTLLPHSRIEQVALLGIIIGGLGTVSSTHMISNVLCLILTFMWGAVLCLTNQAEFLAFLLPVVYIGAIIILFLFVIMMIDFRPTQDKEKHLKRTISNMFLVASWTLGLSFFMWLFLGGAWPSGLVIDHGQQLPANNILEIGKILYTTYLVAFEWAAMILLVAMVAALWLLGLHDESHQKSNLPARPKVKPTEGVTYADVPFRQGWMG